MKNCLYYRETDILILIHMTVILIAEGKLCSIQYYARCACQAGRLSYSDCDFSLSLTAGKTHEAKFYVTRVLSVLEARVQKFSFLYPNREETVADMLRSGSRRDHSALTAWLEDLLVQVFHGELKVLPVGNSTHRV
jgi:hypothetical protein